MQKFVVATQNMGKLREIKQILSELPYTVTSMGELGIDDEIEENGTTFEENALIKAKYIAEHTGEIAMGDDSGLEVDHLGGAPGIFTARFAGEGASDSQKMEKLLGLLDGVPFEQRKARFVCAIAVAFPDGHSFCVRGICEGYINEKPIGENGFGYDPIFYVEEFGCTTAQMTDALKHSISHRGRALALMQERLVNSK